MIKRNPFNVRGPLRILRVHSRRLSEVKFPEEQVDPSKPKIKEFKYPLFHTFLIASTTYVLLNSLYLKLEQEEKQNELLKRNEELENSIQILVNEKEQELRAKQKKWYSIFNLWR
ncbi:uncharacterized protein PRCAT00000478001 [Priceomyces carsonii]|uniref:uncharacterized protein n=1 Tax=Priceomyces carsonii TaxID=28549 RepID=UPI002ED779C4|nr:unnamed protein product [Priceomyces carsonii]